MSMIYYLADITDSKIDQLLANPESIEELLDEIIDAEACVCLEKSWDGIHFLFRETKKSQNDDTLLFLYEGGEFVGDIDVGYGPARVMKSDYLRRLHVALDSVSEEELKANYDPDRMTDVYPSIWDRQEENNREWLLSYVKVIRSFLSNTAKNNLGMIVWLQ